MPNELDRLRGETDMDDALFVAKRDGLKAERAHVDALLKAADEMEKVLEGCLNFFGWSFNEGGLGLDSLPPPLKKLILKRQEEVRAALSKYHEARGGK
jgi:hypothetical protein